MTAPILRVRRHAEKLRDAAASRMREIRAFCPTGPGGGIDNSCGRGGGVSGTARYSYEDVLEYAKSREVRDSRNGTPDEVMEKLAAYQGYDTRPAKVSRSELDEMIASGEVKEIHRGVRDVEHAKQFMDGDYFGGVGAYGSGYYFGENPRTAADYVSGTDSRGQDLRGVQFRAGLLKTAKVGNFEEIMDAMESAGGRVRRDAVESADPDLGAAGRAVHNNVGRYAAAMGYDAIRVGDDDAPGYDFYVVLNRGAVVVDGEMK